VFGKLQIIVFLLFGGDIISRHLRNFIVISIIALVSMSPCFGANQFNINPTSSIINNAYYEPIKNICTKVIDKLPIVDKDNVTALLEKKKAFKPIVVKTSEIYKISNAGLEGLVKLQKYMNKHFNHVDGGPTTATGVEEYGYGDCWGLADWAAKKLFKKGYTTRIVEGKSSLSNNHRWVQVLIDNDWINFDSSLVTKKYGSQPYYHTCAKVRSVIKTFNQTSTYLNNI